MGPCLPQWDQPGALADPSSAVSVSAVPPSGGCLTVGREGCRSLPGGTGCSYHHPRPHQESLGVHWTLGKPWTGQTAEQLY